jgi:hypothetical protein
VRAVPVYSPFPNERLSDRNCTRTTANASSSTLLGSWYSTPSAGACAAGETPAASSCTWSRQAAQHYVHGAELRSLGFNTSNHIDVAELTHNRDVIKRAFEKHEGRCCGC